MIDLPPACAVLPQRQGKRADDALHDDTRECDKPLLLRNRLAARDWIGCRKPMSGPIAGIADGEHDGNFNQDTYDGG